MNVIWVNFFGGIPASYQRGHRVYLEEISSPEQAFVSVAEAVFPCARANGYKTCIVGKCLTRPMLSPKRHATSLPNPRHALKAHGIDICPPVAFEDDIPASVQDAFALKEAIDMLETQDGQPLFLCVNLMGCKDVERIRFGKERMKSSSSSTSARKKPTRYTLPHQSLETLNKNAHAVYGESPVGVNVHELEIAAAFVCASLDEKMKHLCTHGTLYTTSTQVISFCEHGIRSNAAPFEVNAGIGWNGALMEDKLYSLSDVLCASVAGTQPQPRDHILTRSAGFVHCIARIDERLFSSVATDEELILAFELDHDPFEEEDILDTLPDVVKEKISEICGLVPKPKPPPKPPPKISMKPPKLMKAPPESPPPPEPPPPPESPPSPQPESPLVPSKIKAIPLSQVVSN